MQTPPKFTFDFEEESVGEDASLDIDKAFVVTSTIDVNHFVGNLERKFLQA